MVVISDKQAEFPDIASISALLCQNLPKTSEDCHMDLTVLTFGMNFLLIDDSASFPPIFWPKMMVMAVHKYNRQQS